MLRTHGGQILQENVEEAVRKAFAAKGQIEVTGFDDRGRWMQALEDTKALDYKYSRDPKDPNARSQAEYVEKYRHQFPFEIFAAQLGLKPVLWDMTDVVNYISDKAERPFYMPYVSEADDSIWMLEGDAEGDAGNKYWLVFAAHNLFELTERYSLPLDLIINPGIIKIECEAVSDEGGPLNPPDNYAAGGQIMARMECKLMGRDQKIASASAFRSPGDSVRDWRRRTSGYAAAAAAGSSHRCLVGGVIEAVHEAPETFLGVYDGMLRKFLSNPAARSSKIYKFLDGNLRMAKERDLLLRFGRAAGVPEVMIPEADKLVEFDADEFMEKYCS